MSQYFEDYLQFFNENSDGELSEIKKYNVSEEKDNVSEESDTQIYEFSNKYSMGGIACVTLIIIMILLYIYFNYFEK